MIVINGKQIIDILHKNDSLKSSVCNYFELYNQYLDYIGAHEINTGDTSEFSLIINKKQYDNIEIIQEQNELSTLTVANTLDKQTSYLGTFTNNVDGFTCSGSSLYSFDGVQGIIESENKTVVLDYSCDSDFVITNLNGCTAVISDGKIYIDCTSDKKGEDDNYIWYEYSFNIENVQTTTPDPTDTNIKNENNKVFFNKAGFISLILKYKHIEKIIGVNVTDIIFALINDNTILDYNSEYFTLHMLEDGDMTLYMPSSYTTAPSYSVNGEDWITFTSETTLSLKADDKVRVKCMTGAYQRGINTAMFSGTCEYEAYGNVMSLLYGKNFEAETILTTQKTFRALFFNQTRLQNIENLILPATTLVNNCYDSMFRGCTSLTSATKLPATTTKDSCYESMFYGCTSLVEAPKLPATTLASYCYYKMFYSCTSLTTAPELPATTLASSCYGNMFSGCSKLNYIKMLATDINAMFCLINWVNGVASTGTFVKHPDMTTLQSGKSGIPTGWMVEDYDYSKEYFTIEALEDELTAQLSVNACEYRIDDGDWNSLSADSNTPSINKGQTLSFRGNLRPNSSFGIGTFTINKAFNAEGNIMSLLYGDNFKGQTDLSGKYYAFYKLFYDCKTLTDAGNLVLPATTLASDCYRNMFFGCTSLTTAPELPATTLAESCYRNMFYGCTSLTTAPELTATKLNPYCYRSMFGECISLTTAPELPATTLSSHCYRAMFYGCTSLTTAPELPATTLADFCYRSMFGECTSLTTAPQLPATTLAVECYRNMFSSCTSLSTAPELPATELVDYCYASMFYGCQSLTTAPQLPATILASYCYFSMFNGCRSLTEAPDLPASTLESSCYDTMFNGCTSLTTAPELPATILSERCYRNMFSGCQSLTEAPKLPATTLSDFCYQRMFDACSKLNKITMLATDISGNGCLSIWVNGVASTGTFVKHKDMTSLPIGVNGIPERWTVEDYGGIDYSKEYFTIEALEDGLTVQLSRNASEYSIDNGEWVSLTADTATPSINSGQKISFKITNPTISSYYGIGTFTVSKAFNVEGNIMSLLYGDNFEGQINLSGKDDSFSYLFSNCQTLKNAENLILPATILADYCYSCMFFGCTSLTTAPELLATTLADYCYSEMFWGCTGLIETPELPAIKLAEYCYSNMFWGCTSLTTAPQLPATTLASHCYLTMFGGCTSLTEAPELPATTLASNCYGNMFNSCSKLNYIKMLATDISASGCLSNWVNSVASTGTFVKHPNMTTLSRGVSGIPIGWTVEDNYSKEYFTIEALEDGLTVQLSENASHYRIDNEEWVSLAADTATPSINSGQKISFKINNPTISYGIGMFTVNKAFNVEGNIMSLLYGDNFEGQIDLSGKKHAFYKLFYKCITLQNAKNLILPATALATQCYDMMFMGCTSLTEAPDLPATTLATGCYYNMFNSCTSLTTAPKLPATTLASHCYLTMFGGCTSLTEAPELPGTTLASGCYSSMFYGCSNLNYIKMLATDISATNCLNNWVNSVASTGVFVKDKNMTSLPSGNSGIPSEWTVEDYNENESNLITFTIDGTEYQAEEGMSWYHWVNSEYNTNPNIIIQNSWVYYTDNYFIVTSLNRRLILYSEHITNNGTYVLEAV